MTVLELHGDESSAPTSVEIEPTATNFPLGAMRVPPTMSHEDTLYWSLKWRADTAESERARGEGGAVRFDSDDPLDVIRWLLSE